MNNSASRILSLTLALSLCGTGPGSAQDPDGYGAFLDSIEVRVVNVDVVVTDKDGKFVPGLRREDFQLFADGKPVEITHFAAYVPDAVAPAAVGENAVLIDEQFGEDAAVAPPAAYAVLIDQSLVGPSERNAILDQLRRFLASGVRPGDRVLLAAYDQGLRLYTDLTADRAVVDASLAELEKHAAATAEVARNEATLMREITRINPSEQSAQAQAESIFDSIQLLEEQALRESLGALDALSYLSDSLAGVEGRKAVLYAGGGFSANPAERLYTVWQRTLGFLALSRQAGLRENPMSNEIERRQSVLIERAGANRVTIYSIPAGVDRGALAGPEVSNEAAPMMTGGSPARESALHHIATATGGLSLSSGPQLAASLGKVSDDFERYYSLAFTPAGRGGQRLEVKVREGLRVRYRSHFRPEGAGSRSSQTAMAALLFKEAPNPLEAAATAGAGKPEGKSDTLLVPVTVRVPLRHLTLLPEGDHHQAKLTFDFAARDKSGRIQVMERRELPLSVPNDKLQTALRQYVSFDVQLKLVPGAYRVAVLVEDQLGATRSALTLDTEVARP